MDSLRDLEPVERFENRCDVVKFWGSGNSAGGSILNELETINILRRSVEIERVTVIEF